MYALRDGFARYAPRCSRECRSRRFSSSLASYCSHVTPSTPGLAPFLVWKKAARSRSTVRWWKSALNRSVLLLSAACRTRSSALGTPFVRLCVRDVFCWPVFSLVRPLPSTTSAADCSALFGSFVGSMGLSDSPRPCIAGVRPTAFPARPSGPSPEGGHGVSRFSRMEFPHVLEVSDRAGSPAHSPWRVRVCCLPLKTTASAPWFNLISRLNTPPVCAPVNASPVPSRAPTHDSGSPWLAGPSV